MSLLEKLHSQLSGLLKTGFFHIFGASTINRLLAVILSFILVRILSKADYGVYAYAFNIISFFVVLNGLGVTSAILQICSELHSNEKRSDAFFKYGYRSGSLFDIAIAVVILLIAILLPMSIEGSNLLLGLFCLYPLAMLLFDIRSVRLRVLLMNRDFAFATNIQTLLLVIFSIVGAILFNAIGLVIGMTLAYLLTYGYLCVRYPFKGKALPTLSRDDKKDFWKISLLSAFNNGLSQALTLTGTFFIGTLLSNDVLVANYQVATLIPYGLLFIPGTIMTYSYPYFARNRWNKKWTCRNYGKIVFGSLLVMGSIAGILAIIADPVIILLFGEQYLEIVPVFRVLLVGTVLSAVLRQPAGTLLVTQRRLKTNSVIGIATIALNITTLLCLVPNYGIAGVALGYVLTMGFSGLLSSGCYLYAIHKI